ncbi:MAG: ABC transporter permease [Gemmatimonadota bacterium]
MPDTPGVAALAIEGPAGKPDTRFALAVRIGGTDIARALWSDTGTRISMAGLLILAMVAIAAPLISPHDPTAIGDAVNNKFAPPSAEFPFGTDSYSRDVLSRMIFGARLSLVIAFLAASISAIVGLWWGSVAGFAGGTVDNVMMRTVDALLSVPRVLLVLTVIALWGRPTVTGLVLVLGLSGWFGVSRLARAEAMSARGREYVTASRALGASPLTILVRHVVPQALGPVLVATTVAVGNVIVLEAGLTFLGQGIPEPSPSWGNIIYDGRATIDRTWWLTVFPGLAVILTSLAVNSIANRLRLAFNPRQLPAA